MRRVRAIAALVPISLAFAACSGSPQQMLAEPPTKVVSFSGPGVAPNADLHVWEANTDAERAAGLMYVTDLAPGEAMVFRYDPPTEPAFWMRHTLIPLSVAFVDANGSISGVKEMTPCRTDPCPTYLATGVTAMAVEANSGWFTNHGVNAGATMTWGAPAHG